MQNSLRTKLSLTYVLVSLACVTLISVLTNFFLEEQFKDYIIQNQERKNKEIVTLISQQYQGKNIWNSNLIENIGVNELEQGLIIKVTDSSNTVIWDAKVHNNGLCEQMIAHISHNMMSRYPNWKGSYVEDSYPITYKSKEVGKVEIGYYGPYYYNDRDLAFINALNRALIGLAVFSLFFSLLLGAVMAKRLTTPISRVIKAAQMISSGYYADRVTEKSSTKEIHQLTATINNLAESLQKQEILRKRMTADVAHELRTPLATLQSHMEAMIDGIWKPDTERLISCHEEIVRINRLVGGLEKLAKYESENLILNKTEFDVSELVRLIIKNFEIEFKKKNIEIRFNGSNENIYADKDKISQVIINLLSNESKYTPQGGLVDINVSNDEKHVEISIKDNGPGIPSEDLPYIFERFYRADRSRNRMTGGSGIGLTIVKSLVEAHKGKVQVQSKANEGTEFKVILPKKAD